ncbi:MAG: hypothetical protein FWB75_00815, partial [Oscillospiraceae bacterium]|nr:hypothetical protein [Oscillospiraceae bacterium]
MKLPSKKSIFNSPVKVAIVVFVVVFIVALLILSLSDCQSQTTAEGPPGTSVDAAPHTEESSAGESAAGESPAGESSQTPQDLQAEPDSESDQDLETDQVPDEAAPEPVEVESITIVLSAVAYAKGAEITPD